MDLPKVHTAPYSSYPWNSPSVSSCAARTPRSSAVEVPLHKTRTTNPVPKGHYGGKPTLKAWKFTAIRWWKRCSKMSFMRWSYVNDIFIIIRRCILSILLFWKDALMPRIWDMTLFANINEAWSHQSQLQKYENLVKVLQCSNPLLPCLLQLIHECQIWMQGRKWCSC